MNPVNLAAPDSKEANSKNATRTVKGKVAGANRAVVATNVAAASKVEAAASKGEGAASKGEDNPSFWIHGRREATPAASVSAQAQHD
jgi:hypothetical protein